MKASIIVEPDFLTKHVGVRRVILYYFEKIKSYGFDVDFIMPDNKKLLLGTLSQHKTSDNQQIINEPYWTSTTRSFSSVNTSTYNKLYSVKWTNLEVNPCEYKLNLITNPWLCSIGLPTIPNSIGIIYDLVPNLLALGIIRFPQYLNVYQFAYEHNVGFNYYIENKSRILCISNSTKNDFLDLYKLKNQDKSIFVDIPFEVSTENLISKKKKNTVLLVNALDWRKNLNVIVTVLLKCAREKEFSLTIIGQERIPLIEVEDILKKLADSGIYVEWYRNIPDKGLIEKYINSSVLLFPSLYEGLGLPILEAQNYGLPTITSNISSCPEINMNPKLCFNPTNIEEMSKGIADCLDDNKEILSGLPLKNKLISFLKINKSEPSLFQNLL